jgi:exopolyphosphatase/guanosine-5'-triphosphate,3'-diphosphate pyrophosphatase
MPLASVDVGSNSVRLLVGEVRDGRVECERRERAVTRLAGGLSRTGLLREAGMAETLRALGRFSELIKASGAAPVRAVGTSALREAENAEGFLRQVLLETGMVVEVVSGRREGEITATGVLSSMRHMPSCLIMDIGGGSTEWMACRGRKVLEMITVPVGVVKLMERHLRSDPPSAEELRGLGQDIEKALSTLKEKAGSFVTGETALIGTAGTATTLASMDLGLERYEPERVHMHGISLGRLIELAGPLESLPLGQRMRVRGLEPSRADLIIPGLRLTIKLMEDMGFQTIIVSDHGLLEGVLLELAEEVAG